MNSIPEIIKDRLPLALLVSTGGLALASMGCGGGSNGRTETVTEMDTLPNHSICDDGKVTRSDFPATRGSKA